MRRRSALSGGLLVTVVSCAILGATSVSAAVVPRNTSALAPTTTVLALGEPTVTYSAPQGEVVSVTVTSASGTPAGSVAITVPNGNVGCTATLSGGLGSCTVPSYWGFPQVMTIKAVYGGDSLFAGSTSGPQSYTILKDPTTTALNESPATVTYGDEQTSLITALTNPEYQPAGGGPFGTINLTLSPGFGGLSGIFSCYGGCFITFPATAYPAGTVKITSSYAGNDVLGGSSSQVRIFQINKATSRTVLTLSTTKITYGKEQAERLTVRVSPQYAGTPGGKVTIKHGTAVVCTITLAHGTSSCALAARTLPVGTDHLIATYPGNGNFAGSVTAPKALTVVR
jgi:hypothetical protein